MRRLTKVEICEALDENGEAELPMLPVETTVQELADLDASCACGGVNFKEAVAKGYGKRKVRAWFGMERDEKSLDEAKGKFVKATDLDYSVNRFYVAGMIHIKIQTEKTAEKLGEILGIRFEGESGWDGFMVFEDE